MFGTLHFIGSHSIDRVESWNNLVPNLLVDIAFTTLPVESEGNHIPISFKNLLKLFLEVLVVTKKSGI